MPKEWFEYVKANLFVLTYIFCETSWQDLAFFMLTQLPLLSVGFRNLILKELLPAFVQLSLMGVSWLENLSFLFLKHAFHHRKQKMFSVADWLLRTAEALAMHPVWALREATEALPRCMGAVGLRPGNPWGQLRQFRGAEACSPCRVSSARCRGRMVTSRPWVSVQYAVLL